MILHLQKMHMLKKLIFLSPKTGLESLSDLGISSQLVTEG